MVYLKNKLLRETNDYSFQKILQSVLISLEARVFETRDGLFLVWSHQYSVNARPEIIMLPCDTRLLDV